MITAHHSNMLEVIPRLVAEGVVCDAVVTDPPYHLTATVKRLGATSIGGRLAGGFMGQQWDGGDIAFRHETWATIATALRPGAFLVAFGGTRTYHRLACAIEDAGFVIQDTIAWLYGSGFPKRRDMLKPAMELIVLAYKPGGKRTMQIDECRIHTADSNGRARHGGGVDGTWSDFTTSTADDKHDLPDGRWPANVCHDGSEEVTEAFPDAPGAFADVKGNEPSNSARYIYGGLAGRHSPRVAIGDSGSAARFYYCAKADKQDRWGSRHPTVKPVELMKWLVALVTPPNRLVLDPFAGSGTTGIAALATGRDCILIEREEQYIADIRERLAFYEGGNAHSVQAKNRNRQSADHGPLFSAPYDPALDSALSYDAAIQAIGERVKAGEPLPTGGYFGNAR